MIPDSQTNFLYLADTLPEFYPEFFKRFKQILEQSNTPFEFIPKTKDVWAVDYMPIQTDDEQFVQFEYNPSYLKGMPQYRSDVDTICESLSLRTTKCPIILDGGNVIHSKEKVIITERIIRDNPHFTKKKLISLLYEFLKVDNIYFIPELPDDFTGHADGMIRFFDEHTLLVNDFKDESISFQKDFENAVRKMNIDWITVPRNILSNKNLMQANGEYINYLHMKNFVFIPVYNLPEDDLAFNLFDKHFTHYNIIPIDCNEIANDGGVLNCISWNIKLNTI